MAKGLCDSYIWEDIRSVPNAFTGLIPPTDPCVSNLVNTLVSVYSVAILLAGALFSRGLALSLYVLAVATVLLIPVLMAYGKATSTAKVAEPFRDDVVPIQKPRDRKSVV